MREEKDIHGILLYRHRQLPVCGQVFFGRARQHPAGDAGDQRQFSDDTIGIVCPVYAGEPPKMVKQFLRESSFQTNYFYFILACAQNCPQKAVGLRIADKNPKARYRNPHISLQEIIDANRNS